MTERKKLIEVALPLEAINRESAKEKSVRHGHPSTLHLWWSRKPLSTCRAVLFASIIDDPSSRPDEFPTEEAQRSERERLFRIIEDLVKWENVSNKQVLDRARAEILKATDGNPPFVLDPFCGGGSIPLEAQRLGLEAQASDLNPVAVLITKALIEIPPKFAGQAPVNPDSRSNMQLSGSWQGVQGLANDVLYYGKWMRDNAERRIGYLYPKVALPIEEGGGEATVIAWLYCRTVSCPNPACRGQMPLTHSLWLSKKKGQEVWLEAEVDRRSKSVTFRVRKGNQGPKSGTVNRTGATCLICESHVPFDYIRSESRAGRMALQLLAIVAEAPRGRRYVEADDRHVTVAKSCSPRWAPETELPDQALGFRVQRYGFTKHRDLFTQRQLVALTTYTDLLGEAHVAIADDAEGAGKSRAEATRYADATVTYLALGVSRLADISNAFCPWEPSKTQVRHLFGRQAISMLWGFGENNVFAEAAGDFMVSLRNLVKVLDNVPGGPPGTAVQRDAVSALETRGPLICTDPAYYDNISYADLADFFYTWLRRPLVSIYPDLFSTLLTPKGAELIASPYRFDGDRNKATSFFEHGLRKAFAWMREAQNPQFPMTVFYAFKQVETEEDDSGEATSTLISSTGWESMLEALIGAGLAITGTWPMRTEQPGGLRERGRNALASSIVLVSRPRASNAPLTTRRDFLSALKTELPKALRALQRGNIAPVDLAQAAIGPGMAVFSSYAKVLESDGSPMTVRSALILINQSLDEVLAEQEGEYDPATRWAVAWFDQYGTDEGPFGVAETLSKAKNTSVAGLVAAGFLNAKGGKVRLLRRNELDANWDPTSHSRLTVWETTQQLIRSLQADGEQGASRVARQLGPLGEAARDLGYRLYLTCDRRGWAQEGLAYNSLVVAWPEIARLAAGVSAETAEQTSYVPVS